MNDRLSVLVKEAENGKVDSMYEVGNIYELGEEVERNWNTVCPFVYKLGLTFQGI